MKKSLVAYFSASGVTAALAKRLADVTRSDIYEIQPETPYTAADLDWTNADSRSSREMKDKAYRPPIAEKVPDVSGYDVIFVGFPIWWYVAPTIINTFLENCDARGKTIVPFATSGSSGMGRTNDSLRPSCPNAVLAEGRRFPSDAGVKELSDWADKYL